MKKTGLGISIGISLFMAQAFAVEPPPFITGFEAADTPPYAVGNLDGQGTAGSWSVAAGAVNVQTGVVARGVQAVSLGSNSASEVATAVSNNVVWTDLFFRTAGSTNAPSIPASKASAVLFFDSTNILWALDGDGAGGGTYIPVYFAYPSNQFARVSLRKDFGAKTYDVWVEGAQVTNGMGFKDNDRTEVQAVEVLSDRDSYIDDLSVTFEGLDVDTDLDSLVDLNELKFYGTDPTNPDTDGDTMDDGDEVFAWTIPTDSNSYLRLWLDVVTSNYQVRVQTETGLLYTIQRVTNVLTDTWADVPGIINIPGTGGQQSFPVDGTVVTRKFRVKVSE